MCVECGIDACPQVLKPQLQRTEYLSHTYDTRRTPRLRPQVYTRYLTGIKTACCCCCMHTRMSMSLLSFALERNLRSRADPAPHLAVALECHEKSHPSAQDNTRKHGLLPVTDLNLWWVCYHTTANLRRSVLVVVDRYTYGILY